MRSLALPLFASLAVFGCERNSNSETASPEQAPAREVTSFIASAPRGMSAAHIGRPYTAAFEPLQGKDGQSLFPSAGEPAEVAENSIKHEFTVAEDTLAVRANASAWGIVSVEGAAARSRRYMSYRAEQIKHVVELNDASKMRRAPPDAVFYPWRVYYGHSYEVVFSGSENELDAGVKAHLTSVSGGVETAAKQAHLEMKAFGHGLEPKDGQAIFARSDAEIRRHYEPSREPVPILVEWRAIPGRRFNNEPLTWRQPEACKTWLIDWVEFDSPADEHDGAFGGRLDIFLEVNGARTSLADVHPGKKYRHDFRSPIAVSAGENVLVKAWEKDPISANDLLGTASQIFGPRLRPGEIELGTNFRLSIRCQAR